MHSVALAFSVSIIAITGSGLGLKFHGNQVAEFDRRALVAEAGRLLEANGLIEAKGSRIEISGISVAAIYRKQGCPGLIAVVPLPPTAQDFAHVVPEWTARTSREGFVFQGEVFERFPVLKKLKVTLMSAFPSRKSTASLSGTDVLAFREIGGCNLSGNIDWQK